MTRISNVGKVCSVDGCYNEAWAKTICKTHCSRLRRTGALEKNEEYAFREARLYFEKSITLETNNCIIWKFFKSHHGHGQMTVNNRRKSVHAFALERRVGKAPNGKPFALHKPLICHNPSCFNYRHLYWGTQLDNMSDAMIDGTTVRGEKSTFSKLKESDVLSIRKDNRTARVIAEEYPVSWRTIYHVKSGKSWSHLL